MERCRVRLAKAKNAVVLFFTATPIVSGRGAMDQAGHATLA